MEQAPDDTGRFVWVVTWGRMGRNDWRAELVRAYDAEQAIVLAREANPHLLPPVGAVLASAATATSWLPVANLETVEPG